MSGIDCRTSHCTVTVGDVSLCRKRRAAKRTSARRISCLFLAVVAATFMGPSSFVPSLPSRFSGDGSPRIFKTLRSTKKMEIPQLRHLGDRETLVLTEDNIEDVLNLCRYETLAGCFGYTDDSKGTGITGTVDLVELDGPVVVISLLGRFWHKRPEVLQRISLQLQKRFPDIAEVVVADAEQLIDKKGTFYHTKK